MADKSNQLVLNALTRAAADAAGVPLHGNKTTPGLFPTSALGKQTAQRCRDEGYLRCIDSEQVASPSTTTTSTRTAAPVVTITDKGLSYLFSQVSPRQVLEDFVRVLESRETHVAQLIGLARQMHASLEAMRTSIAPVLAEVARTAKPAPPSANGDLKGLYHEFRQEKPAPPAAGDPVADLLACLERWARSGALEDCPLPELYRQAAGPHALSIGVFHDTLRQLEDAGKIHLHPWTGPLCNIPEPPYALLTGHAVSYYASLTLRRDR